MNNLLPEEKKGIEKIPLVIRHRIFVWSLTILMAAFVGLWVLTLPSIINAEIFNISLANNDWMNQNQPFQNNSSNLANDLKKQLQETGIENTNQAKTNVLPEASNSSVKTATSSEDIEQLKELLKKQLQDKQNN